MITVFGTAGCVTVCLSCHVVVVAIGIVIVSLPCVVVVDKHQTKTYRGFSFFTLGPLNLKVPKTNERVCGVCGVAGASVHVVVPDFCMAEWAFSRMDHLNHFSLYY